MLRDNGIQYMGIVAMQCLHLLCMVTVQTIFTQQAFAQLMLHALHVEQALSQLQIHGFGKATSRRAVTTVVCIMQVFDDGKVFLVIGQSGK